MKYLLYGLGIGNKSIKKYFDNNSIQYDIYTDENKNKIVNVNEYDAIIKSSGIPNDKKIISDCIKNKIDVITDLELYSRTKEKQFKIVVTGSNGKTTVTHLLKTLLENEFICGGNIGIPLFDLININKPIIIEASSYMLEYTNSLKPNIFIILNIEKHHLAHHLTFTNYIKCKVNPLKKMSKEDVIIYNYDDILLRRIVNVYDIRKYSFSLTNNLADIYIKEDIIYFKEKEILNKNELKLFGNHNFKNIMVGIIVCFLLKKDINQIRPKLLNFKTLSHRLEIVLKNKNPLTTFINDSKSTNPFSLKVAIDSIKEKYKNEQIILLVGGSKNGIDYNYINNLIADIKEVYSFGEIANYINAKEKFCTLEKLLIYIKTINLDNKVVLFSPGAQSYDEFNSFEDRGNYFKNNI